MNARTLLAFLVGLGCTEPTTPSTNEGDVAPPDVCETHGWTKRALITEGRFGPLRRDLAGDFTVPTNEGDWGFFETFTGCDTIVFVPDSYTLSPLDPTPLVERRTDLRELVETGPRNVHYFFVTTATDGGASTFAEAMQERLDGMLGRLSDEDAAWWTDRVHVVTKRADRLDGWISEAITRAGPGFAIDRFQRVRGFGSLADVTRFDAQLNANDLWSWENNLAYLNQEAAYFNFESDRDDELSQTDWTVAWLFYDDNLHASGRTTTTVELPDATTMATYDTLLVDLTHACDPTQIEFGNCDAWDAIQTLFLCDPNDPDACGDLEMARYITTYHREGRWYADASPFLPWLAKGGAHTFRLNGPRSGHFVSMRLLFGNTGKAMTPRSVAPLWEGGSFDAEYDSRHPPITVDVPATATKVELVMILSGHGFGNEPNCAEFCDHQHTFTVGDGSFTADHPNMGNQQGCLDQISEGTVPNQWGTWWFERSSWCPGKEVDPWVFDLTPHITPGEVATISYTTNYGQGVFGGNVLMRSWLVVSE